MHLYGVALGADNGATSKLFAAADFTVLYCYDLSWGLRAERRFYMNGRRVDQPTLILEFIQLNKYFETLTIKITLKPWLYTIQNDF